MSCIRQYQRRALEALKPEKDWPIMIPNGKIDEYYLYGEKIHLLGISEGIGTCSDLKDINIAVFGKTKPELIQFPRNCQHVICSWSALLRNPTDKELQENWRGKEGISCLVVEGLELTAYKLDLETVASCYYFLLSKKKQFYVRI